MERRTNALLSATYRLLDSVEAQLFWMVQFATENKIPKERLESLRHLASQTRSALQEIYQLQTNPRLSHTFIHPKASDEKYHKNPSDDNVPLPGKDTAPVAVAK